MQYYCTQYFARLERGGCFSTQSTPPKSAPDLESRQYSLTEAQI